MNTFTALDLAEAAATARAERAALEPLYYSDYGQRHGGSNRLHTLVNTVFALTTGSITLVLAIMLAAHLSPAIVVVTILGLGFAGLGTNLALCAKYLRPRRLFSLLGRCALWFLVPVGMLTFVLYIIYYVL